MSPKRDKFGSVNDRSVGLFVGLVHDIEVAMNPQSEGHTFNITKAMLLLVSVAVKQNKSRSRRYCQSGQYYAN